MTINLRFIRRKGTKLFGTLLILFFLLYLWKIQSSSGGGQQKSSLQLKHSNNSNSLKMNTFLLVLIMTGPNNKGRRDAIRHTWLSTAIHTQKLAKNKNVKQPSSILHFFVIGTKGLTEEMKMNLNQEKNSNNDLLLLKDFTDAYEKLTEKLGLMLEWVYKNIKFQYLLKSDDDTFVRLTVIEEELLKRQVKKMPDYLYWGYFYGRGQVKKSGAWKETEWKLCDYYIPYARGGGYILSNDVVEYIAKNYHGFKHYLSEDVSVGSWLAPLDIERIHDIRFDTEYKTRGCSNTFIVSHKQSIDDMAAKHDSLSKNRLLCEKEFSNFHGYQYNWDVSPSKCCVRNEKIP